MREIWRAHFRSPGRPRERLYTIEILATDEVHTGALASKAEVITFEVDNTPPSIIQTLLTPKAGELVKGGDAVQLSLTFSEPVEVTSETIEAYHQAEDPNDPGAKTVTLTRTSQGATNVHTWQGSIPTPPRRPPMGRTFWGSLRSISAT